MKNITNILNKLRTWVKLSVFPFPLSVDKLWSLVKFSVFTFPLSVAKLRTWVKLSVFTFPLSVGKLRTWVKFSVFTFPLSALISCSQQEFEPTDSMKDTPITIASAGVAELTTRATINNDRLEEGSIGVYVYSTTGDSYKGDNIKWTYRNGFWELDDQTVVLFENNGKKQQIAAYYPYAEPTEGKVQITLPEAYGDDYDNYDYLYGEYAPLNSNPAAIKMKHLMAKVTVNLATGTDIDAWDGIKSVELVDVPCMADWTLPGATLGEYGTNTNIALYGNGLTYCGYALPNEAEALALRITTESGRIFAATASLDNIDTINKTEVLSSGTHYTISVKVGKDKVTIEQITMGDFDSPFGDGWSDEEEIK